MGIQQKDERKPGKTAFRRAVPNDEMETTGNRDPGLLSLERVKLFHGNVSGIQFVFQITITKILTPLIQ